MVQVFREVRRVLRNDGTLWLNLGDSYYNYRPGNDSDQDLPHKCPRRASVIAGLKEKDLVGIPWRVAFALQSDGWYLRSDIIWHKPNPMPESVTDRPTRAHEYIFLLTKQERYLYNSEAIMEKSRNHGRRIILGEKSFSKGQANGAGVDPSGNGTSDYYDCPENRNKRSIWTVPTSPYRDAHFATYPPDLIKPCILAGTSPGDTVIDPFSGSGTTGMVSIELGRSAILIELNPEYLKLAQSRCNVTPGLQLH